MPLLGREEAQERRGEVKGQSGDAVRVTLQPDSPLLSAPGPYLGREGDTPLSFAWFDRAALGAIDVRPSFVSAALACEPLGFRHIVHRDERPA